MKNLLPVLILSFSLSVMHLEAQPNGKRIIKGIVIDENKETIIFASVIVKNLSIATFTDLDGRFQLTIPDSCEVLVFRYVGYPSQEVNIQGKDYIVVKMKSGPVLN